MRLDLTSSVLALLFFLSPLTAAPAHSLKAAAANDFLVGAAITDGLASGKEPANAAIVIREDNSITPENLLKWQAVHPRPGVYNFDAADRYVAFGAAHGMTIIGHVLVWHNQTPDWVFQGKDGKPASREELLARMKDHIFTVMGRYKGRIQRWDVVNEAFNDDGSYRASPWNKILGPDYIEAAFRFAHEADPDAKLTYNDYNMVIPAKRDAVTKMVRKLKADGVQIDTVGMQGHYDLNWPTIPQLEAAITAYAAAGVKVAITELDINVLPQATEEKTADMAAHAARKGTADLDPYKDGFPPAMQKKLADRYAAIFALAVKHKADIRRITLWGITDAHSWLNDWPIKGRTSYPLLFDRAGKPKPAYQAVMQVLKY